MFINLIVLEGIVKKKLKICLHVKEHVQRIIATSP